MRASYYHDYYQAERVNDLLTELWRAAFVIHEKYVYESTQFSKSDKWE